MKEYDIIIVGAGAGGVFLAYELAKLKTDAKVLMVDKGAPLEKRRCHIRPIKTFRFRSLNQRLTVIFQSVI